VDVEDQLAKKAILGKWQLIAVTTEDTIIQSGDTQSGDVGLPWTDEEYRSDGTLLFLDSRYYPVGVIKSGKFKIYADSLVVFFDGKGSSKEYSFKGDTLYTGILHYTPFPEDLFIFYPRYHIYKRKN